MEEKGLMVDTSILIDYFRKSDKSKSRLINHFKEYSQIYISSITEFELYNGSKESSKLFWKEFLSHIIVLDFDSNCAILAAEIVTELKFKRKTIDKPDLFIASTAIRNKLLFDTLNLKDFIHIEKLKLLPVINSKN